LHIHFGQRADLAHRFIARLAAHQGARIAP
jgi:hypothetical protein